MKKDVEEKDVYTCAEDVPKDHPQYDEMVKWFNEDFDDDGEYEDNDGWELIDPSLPLLQQMMEFTREIYSDGTFPERYDTLDSFRPDTSKKPDCPSKTWEEVYGVIFEIMSGKYGDPERAIADDHPDLDERGDVLWECQRSYTADVWRLNEIMRVQMKVYGEQTGAWNFRHYTSHDFILHLSQIFDNTEDLMDEDNDDAQYFAYDVIEACIEDMLMGLGSWRAMAMLYFKRAREYGIDLQNLINHASDI